ncbi:hypothetical protein [Rhodococcoides fascians]|uniref:hypothetical protein n=1 Tax=Rhodococcoides fascians TaxID=1828 RepID=UPI00050C7389|nr:hypothetical protein [Rhodococcus fascians]
MDIRYASPADITDEWLPAVPPNAAALIRNASGKVTKATKLAKYRVGSDGIPLNEDKAEAMKQAVLQQVTYWTKSGIDPDGGVLGLAPIISSQSAAGGSVSYVNTLTPEQVRAAVEHLCEDSMTILDNAGLLSAMPDVY